MTAVCQSPGSPELRRRWSAAWTLIELMGVLTIISILAVILVPVLVQQVDRATRLEEEARLETMAAGFEEAVMRTKTIPGGTNWADFLGNQLGWQAQEVLANRRGVSRIFLIDPALRIGPSSGSVLPFVQNWQGSLPPESARVLLISSLGEPLPEDLSSGVATSTNAFNAIWNAAPATLPAGWTWVGRAADLCVRRVALTPLFAPVVLNNFDGAAGRFGVETGSTNLMTSTTVSTWYLRGTALRLHGNNGLLQSTEIVQGPVSYVYENAIWRGRAFMSLGTKRLKGQDLQDAVDLFLTSPWNVNAKNGITQSNVVASLVAYMEEYLTWQNLGFSTQTADLKPVLDAQTLIGNNVTDLIFKP